MPDISQADFDTLEANSRTRLALDQADQAIYGHYQAAHVWKAGDVALANTNPLITYAAPGGAVKDKRPPTPGPMITYDLNVVAVSADQLWLEVAPGLWVKTADVKLKA